MTLSQSWRVVGARVAVAMNASSRLATVQLAPPWSPAPVSTTRRCSASRASLRVPAIVRDSRRWVPVVGVGIARRLQAPSSRSALVHRSCGCSGHARPSARPGRDVTESRPVPRHHRSLTGHRAGWRQDRIAPVCAPGIGTQDGPVSRWERSRTSRSTGMRGPGDASARRFHPRDRRPRFAPKRTKSGRRGAGPPRREMGPDLHIGKRAGDENRTRVLSLGS